MADKSTKSEAELFEEEREESEVVIHPETESQNIFTPSTTDDLKASSFDELQVPSTRPEEDRLLDDGSGEEASVPVPTIGDTYELVVVHVGAGGSALDATDEDEAEGDEEGGTFAVLRKFTHGKGKEKEVRYEVVAHGLVDYPGPQGDPHPDPIETKKERVEESKL
jgi:hypothetical protein